MLNKILLGVLVIFITYNLFIILINCKTINTHINRGIIENFDYLCKPGQTGDGSDGFQCTIGCLDTQMEGRYPYDNMFDAEKGCIARGFKGLCSKQEVIDGMKKYKHLGEGQCCAGYTSDIHQSGHYKGKSVIGYDRTSEAPEVAINNKKRNPDCGGSGRNFKGWNPADRAGAHCCGSARYDDLALEYKKRSDISASLLKVNSKISDLDRERKIADDLNKEAEMLTAVYDNLKDEHIKDIYELCEEEKKLHENDSNTVVGKRKKAIREILRQEKEKLDKEHENALINLDEEHKKNMAAQESRLTNSNNNKSTILKLSKQTYMDARECSNNSEELVVPSLITANVIPDNEDSNVLDVPAVISENEPDTNVVNVKTSLEEKGSSVPEYNNLVK